MDARRQHGRRRDLDALTTLLEASRPLTRVSAASALGDLGDPTAVEPLLRCLRANDDQERAIRHEGFLRNTLGGPDSLPSLYRGAASK